MSSGSHWSATELATPSRLDADLVEGISERGVATRSVTKPSSNQPGAVETTNPAIRSKSERPVKNAVFLATARLGDAGLLGLDDWSFYLDRAFRAPVRLSFYEMEWLWVGS